MSWIAAAAATLATAVTPGLCWAVAPVQPVVPDVQEAVADPEAIDVVVETDADDAAEAAADTPRVGWLEVDEPFREGPIPFAWLGEAEAGPMFSRVLAEVRGLAEGDAPAAGLVVYLNEPALPVSQAAALADAFRDLRKAGVPVYVFAEAFDTWAYSLAAAGDGVWLQRKGGLFLQGFGMEELYLAGTLDKLGVFADFVQIGKFKGADEQLTRTGPSEAWSQNIGGLLDGLYQQVVGRIAEDRGLTLPEFETLMAESWAMSDTELLEAGLVERLVRRDLRDATADTFGDDFTWESLAAAAAPPRPTNPMALLAELFNPPNQRVPSGSVAVLHLSGPIMSGQSSRSDGLFNSDVIGSRSVTESLSDLADDPRVEAVVLRLDSPGGSAQASEVIWQAVDELREEKPVVVSIGGMAASGGYYIAAAADQIVAEPEAILGSIGVVGGKLVTADLFDKIGLGVHQRTRGPNAAIFSALAPFDDRERALVEASMRQVYEQFLERVRDGRGDRLSDLDAIDEGMLFTGQQALELGMTDQTGGLTRAIEVAAEAAGLEDDAPPVFHLPRPQSLEAFLSDAFSVRAPGVGVTHPSAGFDPAALRALADAATPLLGRETVERLGEALTGLTLLRREPVLMLHPTVLLVR